MGQPMSIFDVAGRAMAAQLVRLNTTASNMANAGTVAGSEASAFRALKPVFRTSTGENGLATVDVERITTSKTPPAKRHDPTNPLADANGDIWEAAVDSAAELVDMIAISREYQNNVQVLQTAKSLITETIRLGQ